MDLMDFLGTNKASGLNNVDNPLPEPVNPANVADNSPASPEIVQPQGVEQPVIAADQPKYPLKPSHLTDEAYEDALSSGLSPERISSTYKDFDPNSTEPFIAGLYNKVNKVPDEVNEKRVKSARTIAGVTDALKLLVQGVSLSQGGPVGIDNSSTLANTDKYAQRLRDIYKADKERYDAGLYQATLQDVMAGRQRHERDRAGLLNILQRGQDKRDRAAELKGNIEREQERFGITRKDSKDRFDREMEYKIGRDKKEDAFRSQTLAIQGQRYSGGGRGSSSGGRSNTIPLVDSRGNTFNVDKDTYREALPTITAMLRKDATFEALYSKALRKGKEEAEILVKAAMFDNPKTVDYLSRIAGKEVSSEREASRPNPLLSLAAPAYNGPFRTDYDAGQVEPKPSETISNEAIREITNPTGQQTGQSLVEQKQAAPMQVADKLRSHGYDENAIARYINRHGANNKKPRPTDKYEAIVYDAKEADEKKRIESEELSRQRRTAPYKKRNELMSEIKSLEAGLVREVDAEEIIKRHGLGGMDAAKIRREVESDKRDNAEINRKAQRLYTEMSRLNLPESTAVRDKDGNFELPPNLEQELDDIIMDNFENESAGQMAISHKLHEEGWSPQDISDLLNTIN